MSNDRAGSKKRPSLDHCMDKLSLSTLEAHFHLPLRDVADKFGVCVTFFKKVCRAHGIKRWPHRKVAQIRRTMTKLGEAPSKMTVKELEDLKKKEEEEANGPRRRVPVWDSRKKRKLSGMAAPLERNLALYLREHPDCAVYNGQDRDHDFSPSRPAKRMRTSSQSEYGCDYVTDSMGQNPMPLQLGDDAHSSATTPQLTNRSLSIDESTSTMHSDKSSVTSGDSFSLYEEDICTDAPALETALKAAWLPGADPVHVKTEIQLDVPHGEPQSTAAAWSGAGQVQTHTTHQATMDFMDVLDDKEFTQFVDAIDLGGAEWVQPPSLQVDLQSGNTTMPLSTGTTLAYEAPPSAVSQVQPAVDEYCLSVFDIVHNTDVTNVATVPLEL